jgi:hypothetical protein
VVVSYDNEHNVTVWTNQYDAQKQALKEIVDIIANDFDMDDSSASACADDIDDMMNRGQLGDAVRRWNDFQDDHNSDHAQYYFVSKKQVLGAGSQVAPSGGSSFTTIGSGATCRGPCGQFNEYAQADRSDGTHICRQCSTFNHIFGTKS